MMSYRLACDASDLFTAITTVAGTDNTRSCQPNRPVSVLHIHAKDDERVLFNGGAGKASEQVTDFTSVADSVARWVGHDACQATPRTVPTQAGASCVEHDGCQGGARVKLCVTDTGGHSWPGGQKARGGRGSTALSATDEMTRFFFGQ
jgi:polyhydroxybutyrate depolymerase